MVFVGNENVSPFLKRKNMEPTSIFVKNISIDYIIGKVYLAEE